MNYNRRDRRVHCAKKVRSEKNVHRFTDRLVGHQMRRKWSSCTQAIVSFVSSKRFVKCARFWLVNFQVRAAWVTDVPDFLIPNESTSTSEPEKVKNTIEYLLGDVLVLNEQNKHHYAFKLVCQTSTFETLVTHYLESIGVSVWIQLPRTRYIPQFHFIPCVFSRANSDVINVYNIWMYIPYIGQVQQHDTMKAVVNKCEKNTFLLPSW